MFETPGGPGVRSPRSKVQSRRTAFLRMARSARGVHQLAGEPIEQLRRCGTRATLAKIVERADQPLTEMIMPDAIDEHAGDNGISRESQPVRQFQPVV